MSLLAAVVTATASLVGCGVERGRSAEGLLTDAQPSLEAVAETAVRSLAAADTADLQRLRLTEREHNQLVYPRLPAGRPPQNFPVDIAWANIRTRNGLALSRLLARYAGSRVEPRAVECRGPTERFEGFVVHTDCWVTMEAPSGTRLERQLFRHVLEMGGQFKIFRYYD